MPCRKDGGRVFHTRGPAMLNRLLLKLVYVRGTAHVPSYADRSKRRPLFGDKVDVVSQAPECMARQLLMALY